MPLISFIDFVFPQFQPRNWQLGIAIYRAGGISNVRVYGELVSARVRAGIGEIYEVRMKLHAQGKCVQWMECTCQPYRRHNEKCPHLAAFCLYLDQDQPNVLLHMNLGTGQSDKYLFGPQEAVLSAAVEAQAKPDPFERSFSGASAHDELRDLEASWQSGVDNVVSVDLSPDGPNLLVTVLLGNRRKLTYCLGVDDAWKALSKPHVRAKISKKLAKVQSFTRQAYRIFDIRQQGPQALRIVKAIAVRDVTGQDKERIFSLESMAAGECGRTAVYQKAFGFVPFAEELPLSQLQRWNEYPSTASLEGDNAAALFQTEFARLREIAEVRLDESLTKLSVSDNLDFSEMRLKAASDGKFLVDASVGAEGSLLAIVKARIEGKEYLPTKSGWIHLSEDLDWLQSKIEDGKFKLSSLELIKFRETFAKDAEIRGNGLVVERLRAGLISSADLPMPPLQETRLTLRPYQEEGVKWLWWLYQNSLGGLLADEMGLGKTHQAMGLIATLAKEEPQKMTLVVCPTSVIDHWLDKLSRFVPGVDVVCYHGGARRPETLRPERGHKVILTSYGIMLRDVELFMRVQWALVVLDEAHLVKNQTTRTYRAACKLTSQMRLCLTGTPLENDLMELKNLFDYILPSYLGSDSDFKKKYLAVEEKDPLLDLELHRLIHPFKMRRNKIDVLKDLPEKVEDVRHCHLTREQHRLYMEALALKGASLVEAIRENDGPVPYIHIFSVITLLKQICDDPALVDGRYEEIGSGKLQLFDELLEEALASEQKVVVFSQYAKMIARLSARLARRGIKHVTLTGSTVNRGEIVRQFQENSEIKVFLGSLLAGGTGIDLTAANVVIHFDRWWNAAKENQATDRVHRIGQVRNVQVYKLVTRGTLEERIDEIISRKREIFERFVDQDSEIFRHLSREDLLNLLAPPGEGERAVEEPDEDPGLFLEESSP